MNQKQLKEAFFKEHPYIYLAFKKHKVLSATRDMKFFATHDPDCCYSWIWKNVFTKRREKYTLLQDKIIIDLNKIRTQIREEI